MAKNKNLKETSIENFYDLKVEKIDELVAALKGEDTERYGEVSMKISDATGEEGDKQFNPYRTDFWSRIPCFLKALFIKWWFAGMICLFVNMGLGLFVSATSDLILLDGIFLGLVTDVLVNPLFCFMETRKGEYDNFEAFPFPFKVYWTFFINPLYYVGVATAVNFIYNIINTFMFPLAIEPLSWALIILAVDMLFIGVKDLAVYLYKLCKNKEKTDA